MLRTWTMQQSHHWLTPPMLCLQPICINPLWQMLITQPSIITAATIENAGHLANVHVCLHNVRCTGFDRQQAICTCIPYTTSVLVYTYVMASLLCGRPAVSMYCTDHKSVCLNLNRSLPNVQQTVYNAMLRPLPCKQLCCAVL